MEYQSDPATELLLTVSPSSGSPSSPLSDTSKRHPAGTTLIYVPPAVASAIYAAIPGASTSTSESVAGGSASGTYQYPCEAQFELALQFAGAEGSFGIDLADFNIGKSSSDTSMCIGAIMGMDFNDAAGKPLAIVGDVVRRTFFLYDEGKIFASLTVSSAISPQFLKSWYSVYDYEAVSGAPGVSFAASAV